MSERDALAVKLEPGEVLVREAVRETGYSHSHIIRMIKEPKYPVEGRRIPTPFGEVWVVKLLTLKSYQQQPHKGGPLGQKLQRKKKTPKGEDPKTEAAA